MVTIYSLQSPGEEKKERLLQETVGSFSTNPSLVSMPEILEKTLFVLSVIPPQILMPRLLTPPPPLEGILQALGHTTPTLCPHPSCHCCQSHSLVFSTPSITPQDPDAKPQVKPAPATPIASAPSRGWSVNGRVSLPHLRDEPRKHKESQNWASLISTAFPYSQDALHCQTDTKQFSPPTITSRPTKRESNRDPQPQSGQAEPRQTLG
uniref:Uncharacterized protein n=1 Tax=Mus musculus TaxID=10090 RepID=Q3U2U3_MOUSE|nr:unnamed protein product [Mus musculus]